MSGFWVVIVKMAAKPLTWTILYIKMFFSLCIKWSRLIVPFNNRTKSFGFQKRLVFEWIQFSNESSFRMVGFRIPTVYYNSKWPLFWICTFEILSDIQIPSVPDFLRWWWMSGFQLQPEVHQAEPRRSCFRCWTPPASCSWTTTWESIRPSNDCTLKFKLHFHFVP